MPTKNKYKDYDNYVDELFTGSYTYPLQRISYAKKKAYDFRWAEKCADFYDYYYGDFFDKDKIKNLKLNYNLYNGRGEEAMKQYSTNNSDWLAEEGLDMGFEDVQHHPLIDQIAKAMVGEQQMRPLTPMAIDSSGYNVNLRKKKKLELLQEHIRETVIAPIQQQVTMEYMQEMGIQDPYSLNPDQQQQFQSDVSKRVQSRTPSEIEDFMRNEYKSPSEMQAQKLLDYLMSELNVKFVTDQGFKHAVISGEEIYYVGARHDKPVLDLVNPVGFTSSATSNTFFVEDGEWAKYEQYIKYTDLFNQYGDKFTRKDLEKLDMNLHGYSTGRTPHHEHHHKVESVVAEYDANSGGMLYNQAPDIRTRDGQEFMKSIYNKFGTDIDGYTSVRKTHLVWKSLRKLKYIHRVINDKIHNFWVDESYTLNRAKGDIKEDIVWTPEVWETTKIGTIDALYLDKRPVPSQYRSLDDPWDVKLPYIGVQYGKLFNNSKNVAPMDLGKPWQYKFNVQMAKIHEMEATDIGKIMLYAQGAKPKDWSWGKFLTVARYGKIAPVDLHQEGVGPVDASVFKAIDLSNINDLAGKLQYLEFIRNQVAVAMSYNPSRLGNVAPRTPVTNNQQNIVQSSYQTEDLYSTHNKVVENVLNALVKCARMAFKDNELAKTYLLDDMSIAELEVNWEILDQAKLGIKIRNSSDDFNNIQQVKQLGQAMVQNGMLSFPELIKLQWAKSGADVLNIAEKAQERVDKMREQQAAQQEEMMKRQMEIQQQLTKMQQDFEFEKQRREHVKDMGVASIDSEKFAKQYDIDKDGVNDSIQARREEQIMDQTKMIEESKQKDKDRELDREKHKDEMRIKKEELRIKEIVAKKPTGGGNSK